MRPLRVAVRAGALFTAAALVAHLIPSGRAQTGTAVPEFAELDTITQGLLTKYRIPGASVAVSYQGRLVYARAFGVTDRGGTNAVTPDSIFRFASVSKTLTSLGILKLVDQGKVGLDDKVFGQVLTDYTPPPGKAADPRYAQMTVRQMLQHVSGMPQNLAGDPTFPPISNQAADAFGVSKPAASEFLVRFTQTLPPAADPGTRYVYSNIGFTTLGRIIEKASGKSYERFLQEDVLAPIGITRLRIGKTRLSERFPGEVRYHMFDGDPLVQSVYPNDGMVERPYGGYYLEGIQGAGAWTGTPVDLVRILSRLEQSRADKIISSAAWAELIKRPAPPVSVGTPTYYGLGYNVRPIGDNNATIWHVGSLAGFRSYVLRLSNDACLAVIFNMRTSDEDAFGAEADAAYTNFLARARTWPSHDYFPQYYPGDRARIADRGIVNAASFAPGSISPGQILTVFGANLGPKALATAQLVDGNRLSPSLEGTRVLFDGTPGPLVYVAETQLSVIAPYNIAGKQRVRVEVERLGVASAAVDVNVVEAAPAFFTANSSGSGGAAATVFPEARVAVLYATGEGLTTPLPADGALAVSQPLPVPRLPAKVLLGAGAAQREAEILYAGAAPGLTAGLFQINIRYPEGTPSGTPLTLQVGTFTSPTGVTLVIPQ